MDTIHDMKNMLYKNGPVVPTQNYATKIKHLLQIRYKQSVIIVATTFVDMLVTIRTQTRFLVKCWAELYTVTTKAIVTKIQATFRASNNVIYDSVFTT